MPELEPLANGSALDQHRTDLDRVRHRRRTLGPAPASGQGTCRAAGTLVIGVLGSTLGPFVLSMFLHDANFNPIGPRGLLAAVGGFLVALVAYRLIARRRARRHPMRITKNRPPHLCGAFHAPYMVHRLWHVVIKSTDRKEVGYALAIPFLQATPIEQLACLR